MVQYCHAFGCNTRPEKGVDVGFHRFPTGRIMMDVWLKAMHMKGYEPPKTARICSHHFAEECFSYKDGKRRLMHGCVPTIFPDLAFDLQQETKKRYDPLFGRKKSTRALINKERSSVATERARIQSDDMFKDIDRERQKMKAMKRSSPEDYPDDDFSSDDNEEDGMFRVTALDHPKFLLLRHPRTGEKIYVKKLESKSQMNEESSPAPVNFSKKVSNDILTSSYLELLRREPGQPTIQIPVPSSLLNRKPLPPIRTKSPSFQHPRLRPGRGSKGLKTSLKDFGDHSYFLPDVMTLKARLEKMKDVSDRLSIKLRAEKHLSKKMRLKFQNASEECDGLKKDLERYEKFGRYDQALEAMESKIPLELCKTVLMFHKIKKEGKLSGPPKPSQHSEVLKEFAVKLHKTSPEAYSMIREAFDRALPHPKLVSKLIIKQKIDDDPVFAEEHKAKIEDWRRKSQLTKEAKRLGLPAPHHIRMRQIRSKRKEMEKKLKQAGEEAVLRQSKNRIPETVQIVEEEMDAGVEGVEVVESVDFHEPYPLTTNGFDQAAIEYVYATPTEIMIEQTHPVEVPEHPEEYQLQPGQQVLAKTDEEGNLYYIV